MLPTYYEFENPVRILSGLKALDNLPFELEQLGARKPLIITDPGIVRAGILKHVINAFRDSHVSAGTLYDQVPPDSSLAVVKELAGIYREGECDSIIAVGGGSVIDTAKGLNIMVTEETEDLRKFVGSDVLKRPLKPLVVVPTTSGTGSEVTMVAVIADKEKHVKLPFTSRHLLPRLAILDPRMTLSLPPHITAATAMDSLTHAVEAYTCLQKNPLSDAYASAAIRLIRDHLFSVVENGEDEIGRLALANASCLAGVAFSNSMVGLIHALGHGLGGACSVPHGVAMNIFLPYGLEYNMGKIKALVGELLLPLAGQDVYASTPDGEKAEKAVAVIREMQNDLHRLVNLPRTLREAGVPGEKLEEIADKAIGDGALLYNPEGVDRGDALEIVKNAF
jgi:alcohol dehydrogenase